MHYGRLRRNGTMEKREPKPVLSHSNGYLLRWAPHHPIAKLSGSPRVYEHRLVFFDANGEGPFACHVCGSPLSWADMHVDHLDDDKTNNAPENLAAACPTCNQARGLDKMRQTTRERHAIWIEHGGERKTLGDWADAIGISLNSLKARIDAGWPLEEALAVPRPAPAGKTKIVEEVGNTPRSHMTASRRARILAAASGVCAWCKTPIADAPWIADHRVPLALGGADSDDNLQPIHAEPCNKEKTAADITAIAKAKRLNLAHTGQKPPPTRKLKGRGFQRRWGDLAP